MPDPITLAGRQQVYLERLKSGYVKKYGSFTGRIAVNIRQEFGKLDKEIGQLSRTGLARLLVAVDSIHYAESRPAMEQFTSALEPLAAYASRIDAAQLDEHLANPPRWEIPTAEAAFKRAVANPIQATGQGLLDFTNLWPQADVDRINDVIRIGWAQGLTNAQMLSRIMNGPQGLQRTARDVAAVMQTATQHVATQSRVEFFEDNGDLIEGYEWVSTLDNKTSPQCKSLDGRKFPPGKGPLPPIHVRCRSTIAPVLAKEFQFLKEGATRASSGPNRGYVDANETYYSWLQKQPAGFQDVALGPARAKLFRDGGLSPERFAALNLGKDFQPLSLDEMRKIEPGAFRKAGLN